MGEAPPDLEVHLVHHRDFAERMVATEGPWEVKAFCDAAWGGEIPSRRSTSGGVLALSGVCVSTWSRTQGCVALSSAEAEYMALVLGAQAGLQLSHMLAEMGITAPLILYTDSNAARGAAEKEGVLQMKHLVLKELLLKELVEEGILKIERVAGKMNVADVLTKPLLPRAFTQCQQKLPSWDFGEISNDSEDEEIHSLEIAVANASMECAHIDTGNKQVSRPKSSLEMALYIALGVLAWTVQMTVPVLTGFIVT